MAKDYYKILEISKSASLKEMEKSYKRLAKKWHPDKWRTAANTDRLYAEEMMKDINEAHDKLKKILPISPRIKAVVFPSSQPADDNPKSKYAHEDNIWDVDLNKLSNNYFGSATKSETNSAKVKDSLWATDSEKLTDDLFGI